VIDDRIYCEALSENCREMLSSSSGNSDGLLCVLGGLCAEIIKCFTQNPLRTQGIIEIENSIDFLRNIRFAGFRRREDMATNEITVKEKTSRSPLIRWAIVAVIVLFAFLIGLIPMAMQKWSVQRDLAESQKNLRRSEIKVLLASSIVDAARGEYEPARQAASNYFTGLNQEIEKAEADSFLKKGEAEKLKPMFSERDTIITMLAQRDPAAVGRLNNLYVAYLQGLGEAQPPAKPELPAANSAP
jgi:hypothetical protein